MFEIYRIERERYDVLKFSLSLQKRINDPGSLVYENWPMFQMILIEMVMRLKQVKNLTECVRVVH